MSTRAFGSLFARFGRLSSATFLRGQSDNSGGGAAGTGFLAGFVWGLESSWGRQRAISYYRFTAGRIPDDALGAREVQSQQALLRPTRGDGSERSNLQLFSAGVSADLCSSRCLRNRSNAWAGDHVFRVRRFCAANLDGWAPSIPKCRIPVSAYGWGTRSVIGREIRSSSIRLISMTRLGWIERVILIPKSCM